MKFLWLMNRWFKSDKNVWCKLILNYPIESWRLRSLGFKLNFQWRDSRELVESIFFQNLSCVQKWVASWSNLSNWEREHFPIPYNKCYPTWSFWYWKIMEIYFKLNKIFMIICVGFIICERFKQNLFYAIFSKWDYF